LLKAGLWATTDVKGFSASDGIVDKFKLKHGPEEIIFDVNWTIAQGQDKVEYSLESKETGFTILDLAEPRRSSPENQLRLDITSAGTTGYLFIIKRVIRAQ